MAMVLGSMHSYARAATYQALYNSAHVSIANFIASQSRAEDIVYAWDIGYIGAISHRRILDFVGIVSPEVIPYNRRQDYVGVLKSWRPRWAVVGYYGRAYRRIIDDPWFRSSYVLAYRNAPSASPPWSIDDPRREVARRPGIRRLPPARLIYLADQARQDAISRPDERHIHSIVGCHWHRTEALWYSIGCEADLCGYQDMAHSGRPRRRAAAGIVRPICQRLVAAGIPLTRGYVSTATLHPLLWATGIVWRNGGIADAVDINYGYGVRDRLACEPVPPHARNADIEASPPTNGRRRTARLSGASRIP